MVRPPREGRAGRAEQPQFIVPWYLAGHILLWNKYETLDVLGLTPKSTGVEPESR